MKLCRLLSITILLSLFSLSAKAQMWQQLYNQLNQYYTSGEYETGNTLCKQALSAAETEFGKNHENYGHTLIFAGHFSNLTYDYKEAEKHYKNACLSYEKSAGKNSIQYAIAEINLGNVYKSLLKYKEAEKSFLGGLAKFQTVSGKSLEYAGYLYYLGSFYESVHRYEDAEIIYAEMVGVYKQNGETSTQAYGNALFAQAALYERWLHYPMAEIKYREALEVYKSIEGINHPFYASTINYIGHLYHLQGEFTKAENYYRQALDLCKKSLGENHEYYAAYLNNIANLFQNMGRKDEAITNYLKVSEIYKKTYGENHSHYATALNNLALVYVDYGDYQTARSYYSKAIEIYINIYGNEHPYVAIGLYNLANYFHKAEQYNEAIKLYKQAADIYLKTLGPEHPDYAKSLNALGLSLKYSGNLKDAEKLYLQALEIQKKSLPPNHISFTETLSNLALFYEEEGKMESAEKMYEELVTILIHQIDNYLPTLTETEKESFYYSLFNHFQNFNSFALKRYKENPEISSLLLNSRLSTKAMILHFVKNTRERILKSGDEELLAQYNEWVLKKELLGKLYCSSSDEIKEAGLNQEQILREANELEKYLTEKSALFPSGQTASSGYEEIQKKLLPGQAIIEIIRASYNETNGDSIVYAALIIKEKGLPELIILPNGNELEGKYYKYYRNALTLKIEDEHSYNQYWKAIKSETQGIKKIYFSADGIYHQISISSLFNVKTNTYNIEDIDIVFINNPQDILNNNPGLLNNKRDAILIGYPDFESSNEQSTVSNPSMSKPRELNRFFSGKTITKLKGTYDEVHQISQILSDKNLSNIVYTGQEASESLVKASDNPQILHIATHGFFIEESSGDSNTVGSQSWMENIQKSANPLLRSGILLAGAGLSLSDNSSNTFGKEDGILTAYEALNLNLANTYLVTLSACETGLGDNYLSEGVYGLKRSFQIAGSRYVLMSLWKVNDQATQELMVSFYKHLIDKQDIHAAFKTAQQEIKAKYKHHYYWAAFVLTGV